MKTAPKFLFAFTLFLNDLWLYKFHRKFHPQYPNSTLAFMDKINIAKELQISPAFLSSLNFLSNIQVASANNALQLQQLKFETHDPQQVYFLNSAQDLYLSSLLTTLLYFCAIKAMHGLLYLMRSRGWMLLELYRLLRDQSRWWNLLVATLEANCVVLVFDCALQLLSLGCFCPLDRINNVVMLLLLFGML